MIAGEPKRGVQQRCATGADLRGDPMIGTAFPASRLLLVEQSGAWGFGGLRESGFPAEVAAELERRANAAGVRVQAIRRPGRRTEGPAAWAFADTRDDRQQVRWGRWTAADDLFDVLAGCVASEGTAPGEPSPDPVYLVCAHGKHDVCCALRGRPVAQALEQARPGQVWETSHLGGDRFGANVLVLPSGQLYGRVLPFAANDLADATDAGRVLAPLLRGRIGQKPAAQAAVAHVHETLGVGTAEVRVLTVGDVAESTDGGVLRRLASVRLAVPTGEITVTVQAQRVPASGLTCRSPGPARFWAYMATGCEAVPVARADPS